MIADIIGNYLDNLEEREFDAPFISLLRVMGFYDIHFLHGTFEFGKDFIAKRLEAGVTRQFAFQTKAGNISLPAWHDCRGQIDLLRTNSLAHPNFDRAMPREAIFVTTGRLIGGAPLAAQEYSEHLAQLGELGFTTWDKETLVERMSTAPEVGLAGMSSALFSLIGKIDDGSVRDLELEHFSRRWFAGRGDTRLTSGALEAAIISNRLRRRNRGDLAAFVALCLIRAASVLAHGSHPPDTESVLAGDIGRGLFHKYASDLFANCNEETFDPAKFVLGHGEASAIVTYPIRCMRLIETLGLLGLLERERTPNKAQQIASFLAKFCEANPGSTHPISDHWAVSLIAPTLLLWKAGYRDTVRRLLKKVVKWIADRYESDNLGLAGPYCSPDEEINYLLGSSFEHVDVVRRPESYVSTIVLDLSALMEMGDLFEIARNEFLAVKAQAPILEVPDSASQYLVTAEDARYEANAPYTEKWAPTEQWKNAPHHDRGPNSRYLERIGKHWDQLAIVSVLRDRHFVKSLHKILESSL